MDIRERAMRLADELLPESNCKKRQVAFVVYDDYEILDWGVNLHPTGKPCFCKPGVHDRHVLHAESILRGKTYKGASAVVTYAPCLEHECAQLIKVAGIVRLDVKEIKHIEGVNYLTDNGIAVFNEWI